MSDAWIEKVQEELNNKKAAYIPYLGDVRDVRPMPQTVCLVYMTEGLHHPAMDYTEVYKDEDLAVKSLLARGFLTIGVGSPDMYFRDSSRAVVRANVKVKTDE